MKKWKLLGSKIAFDNQWFKVRQDKVKLPGGKVIDDYFVWLEGDIVLVVPVTKDKKIILVKQYKHASGQFMTEYPAGYVDKGETPKQAAKREFLEETGYSGGKWTFLGKMVNNPTKIVGTFYFYLAKDVEKIARGKIRSEDTEEIEVLKLPPKKVLKMVEDGEIWVNSSVAATHLAFKKLGFI